MSTDVTETINRASEVEATVIGSIIIDPRVIDGVMLSLSADDFADPLGKVIYGMLCNIRQMGEAITTERVLYEARQHVKDVERSIVVKYLAECASNALPWQIDYYAKEVKQLSVARRLRRIAKQFVDRAAVEPEPGTNDAVQTAEWMVSKLSQVLAITNDVKPKLLMHYAQEFIERVRESRQTNTALGTMTGFYEIDDGFGGLFPGELTICGARPGGGKSALGIQIAANIAKTGRPALMFAMEMGGQELASRALAGDAKVSTQKIRTGTITDEELNRLEESLPNFNQVPFYIDDCSTRDINQIEAISKVVASGGKLGLIVVDYVALVKPTAEFRGRHRNEQISEITKGLKRLAKDLECPVLALAQINRESEKDSEIAMRHFSESASIEQDANSLWAMQLHKDNKNLIVIKVLKNRNGPTGWFELNWNAEFTLFSDNTDVRSLGNYNAEFEEYS